MKSGGTQVEIKKPTNDRKYNAGDVLECTHAASCGYRAGDQYTVYLNGNGWKCLRGKDGLEDIISMLISTFKKVAS